MMTHDAKLSGCGVGLRTKHYDHIFKHWPKEVEWFEVITENFMDTQGKPLRVLEKVRSHYPVALHGVSLSIGSTDPLNDDYLNKLKGLVNWINPAIVSDHLCWTGMGNKNIHDLLPLPFTKESLKHIVPRIGKVQESIGRKIFIENVSSYVTYRQSVMPEWEYIVEIAERSGCGILLDLNNVYVNAVNHGFDPLQYIRAIPKELVGQFHLAGHTDMGGYLFDTHGGEVIDSVWALYREALQHFGKVATLIEWDEHIPEFEVLAAEAIKAREFYKKVSADDKAAIDPLHQNPSKDLMRKEFPVAPSLVASQQLMSERIIQNQKLSNLNAHLNPQGGVDGDERMSVYAGGFLARVHESLTQSYPALKHIVGDEAFGELCEEYGKKIGSDDYNLNYAGKNLTEFLADSELQGKLPFVSDLAELEWRLHLAFDTIQLPEEIKPSLENIAPDDFGNLQFKFQPYIGLMSSDWPIIDLWKTKDGPRDQISVDMVDRPQCALITRSNYSVNCHSIDWVQYKLLSQLMSGVTLQEAIVAVVEAGGEDALKLQEWFSAWLSQGLFSQIMPKVCKEIPVPATNQ